MNIGLLLCFALFLPKTDGLYGYGVMRCQFSSEEDVLYTGQLYFNKRLIGSYNSTEGKYTGYTEKGINVADGLNKNPALLDQEKKNLEQCKETVHKIQEALKNSVVEPYVRVISAKSESSQHPGIIVCSAYNFYPKPITLTWMRNGREVTSDVTATEEMSNGNWLYQKHSLMEYTPQPEDTIICMVEHASLPEPKQYMYMREDSSGSMMNKISVGTAGLLLGLAFTIVGVIYYKKKHTRGRVLVPSL